ncbi:MAG: hypothetical protein A3E79_12090 [Burkholderiales bacterium RIFCSPHIGHO2_12_FULL_61_11]|nr:MAG: hypothetical protein A3E79_12090 [Burkholderiales bacterium RIFCSPHIGHO2_12_FULL_61_11]
MANETSIDEQLSEALERADADSRHARVERIKWLSLHERRPGAILGRTETMRILSEARETFIDGHFVAALLLATSFIEHTLAEELQLLGHVTDSPNFANAVAIARKHKVFPEDWLARTDALRLKRNPFSHLKEPDHKHNMGVRFRKLRIHPMRMLEADAKDAIGLMWDYFVATLREADA